MYKLRIKKGEFIHEQYALDMEYLQKLLTHSRKQGYDGFIFTDAIK